MLETHARWEQAQRAARGGGHGGSAAYERGNHMSELKFYRNKQSGEVLVALTDGDAVAEGLEALDANTTDAATEKHVPVVEREGDKLVVKVGSVAHPMLDEHSIQFVALDRGDAVIVKHLKPGQAPEATFCAKNLEHGAVYEYCNLHGLWKAEF